MTRVKSLTSLHHALSRQCPLDGHLLIGQDLGGPIEVCPRCGGEAVPGALLHRLTGHRLRPERGPHVQSLLACPDGHGPMQAAHVQGIRLEQCGTCLTAWLDEGERPRLARRPPPRLSALIVHALLRRTSRAAARAA